jgi:hypothetical protein
MGQLVGRVSAGNAPEFGRDRAEPVARNVPRERIADQPALPSGVSSRGHKSDLPPDVPGIDAHLLAQQLGKVPFLKPSVGYVTTVPVLPEWKMNRPMS